MAINVAHIKNGIVDNVAVYEELPVSADAAEIEFIDVTGFPIGVGWEYANGTFSKADMDYVYSIKDGKIDLTPAPAEEAPAE